MEQDRQQCPKCEGLGFYHQKQAEKPHKKASTQRCKHCIGCAICAGAGILHGKEACTKCNVRGFVHLNTKNPHQDDEDLRCFYCTVCQECKGAGVKTIGSNTNPNTSNNALSKSNENSVDYKMLSMPIQNWEMCPKCSATGFLHAPGPNKHNRSSGIRCQNCVTCHVCEGSARIANKIACPTCSMNGFIHSKESNISHSGAPSIRCNKCIDCPTCKGFCVIDKGSSSMNPRAKMNNNNNSNPHPSIPLNGLSIGPPPSISMHMGGIGGSGINPMGMNFGLNSMGLGTPSMIPGFPSVFIPGGTYILAIADGPGKMTYGGMLCSNCSGLGFRHSFETIQEPHTDELNRRCPLCIDCTGCEGNGFWKVNP